jgi:peptidoglycan/LPS O-acetylase OafA/YrhL
VLARIGTYSYSIYLWHMPFTLPVMVRISARVGLWESPLHLAMSVGIYVLLAVGLGAVMYQLVERRALGLRERFCPSQASAIELPSAGTGGGEGEPLFGQDGAEPERELQPAM